MIRAIIYNQEFEIGWLEDLKSRVSAGPEQRFQIGNLGVVRLPGGLTGSEHRARFQKALRKARDRATAAPLWAAPWPVVSLG
jgi:hypothetical protein